MDNEEIRMVQIGEIPDSIYQEIIDLSCDINDAIQDKIANHSINVTLSAFSLVYAYLLKHNIIAEDLPKTIELTAKALLHNCTLGDDPPLN